MKKNCWLSFLIFFVILLADVNAFASDTLKTSYKHSYTKSAGLYYSLGTVIKTHEFVKGINPLNRPLDPYQSVSLEYSIHTDGRKFWEQLYGYPVWGFGLNFAFFNDENELGKPISFYTFFNIPVKRWRIISFNFEIDAGFSFNWKQHYPLENSYRYPIGSFSTMYIGAALNATFHIGNHFDLSTALALTHYSNGSVKLPNYGLNLFAPRLGLQYIFNKRPDFIRHEKPKYIKEWEWLVLISPSMRQISFEYFDSDSILVADVFNYRIFTLSTAFNRQISHVFKIGAGIDVSYNEAYAADTVMVEGKPQKATINGTDKILLGLYPSVEILINKISIILQPGFYIYRKEVDMEVTPASYQRIGIKYHFTEHFFGGINVRAFGFTKADFIEANIGYRIKWSK